MGGKDLGQRSPAESVDMASTTDTYRTRDGRAYFKFRFVPQGFFFTHWEIDILAMPSYGGRSEGLHETHRLPSDRSDCRYRVCIGDESSVSSLSDARRWAGSWAEETWKYIQWGERF